MNDMIKDPAREPRWLRAALEGMKQKRNLAADSFVAAMGCLYVAERMDEMPDTVR